MSVLPIITYNDPVLRHETNPVEENNEELQKLIDDMFETMYESNGVGLAAPQIGKSIRLFVMDADAITEEVEDEKDLGPMVFINPQMVSQSGDKLKLEEGCLSIPDVRDEVSRPDTITISYQNRHFEDQKETFSGWVSRVIQHEYDHLSGVLFIDYLSAFKRRLHKSTLRKIESGSLKTDYAVVPKIDS